MLVVRPLPAPATLATWLAALLALAAVASLPWLVASDRGSAAAPAEPSAAELATVVGAWRDPAVLLRLRLADGLVWARSNDGRWERLVPSGRHRLRAATLGYEIDIGAALATAAASPMRRVIGLRIDGRWRELELQRVPVIGGIETVPYLRGSMNDWAAVAPMNGVGDGIYSAAIELARGEHQFKIGSEDWFRIDYGGARAMRPDGAAMELLPVGPNIHLAVPAAGLYRFRLDLRDGKTARVSVSREPSAP